MPNALPPLSSPCAPGRLLGLLVMGAGLASGTSGAIAQQNASNSAAAVTAYCSSFNSTSPPPGCDAAGVAPQQFAPDRFVMQSVSAFATVSRQFQLVDSRLSELRDLDVGGGGFGLGASTIKSSVRPAPAPLNKGAPSPDLSGPAAAPPSSSSAGTTGAASGGAAGLADTVPPNPLGLYIRAEVSRNNADPTSFDPGFRANATEFTFGGDYLVSPNAVVGASVSGQNSRSTLDQLGSDPLGYLTTRGTSVSLYGAYYPAANAYMDATLVFGHSRYASVRRMPAINETAIGDTSGRQHGINLGGGYSFTSSRFNFGPYGRLAYTHVTIDSFTEEPNPSNTNLSVQSQSANSLVGTLGGQVSYTVSQSWGVLVPNARLEWAHQFKDDRARNILGTFSGGTSGPAIDVGTTPPDKNYFNLGLGVAAHFGVGRSALVYYQAQLGHSNLSSHALTAELRLEF